MIALAHRDARRRGCSRAPCRRPCSRPSTGRHAGGRHVADPSPVPSRAARRPDGPTGRSSDRDVTVDLNGLDQQAEHARSRSILALTLLSLLPAILLTCTSFTKILVVLA